jgi:hypothetical protein
MARKKGKKEQAPPKVNEPIPGYLTVPGISGSSKEIRISSFEEQEEENYKFWAQLTPEQRLGLHYHMIIQFYAEELAQHKKPDTIKIGNPE